MRNQSTSSQDDALDQIDTFNSEIDTIYGKIATLKDEKFEAESVVRELEKEVGPIKYVAQLLFGGDGEELLDKAVQVFILMLVFVFDPLAVMLVIAANQTLLRYGINLEKAGPDDDGNNTGGGNNDGNSPTEGTIDRSPDDQNSGEGITQGQHSADNSVHLQQVGTTGEYNSLQQEHRPNDIDWDHAPSKPSAVDDAATAMAESAARIKDREIAKLKKELKKKPKEVIKEVEKIIEKEPDFKLDAPKSIKKLEKKIQEKLNGK